MAIRTSIAVFLSISILFVGVFAISESAQQHQPAVNSTAAENASDMADGVFNGIFQAGTGIVWFGVAAFVVVALGFLVYAGSGGR